MEAIDNCLFIPQESVALTILYHAIENIITVVNTTSATYVWCMMGKLDVHVITSNEQRLSSILIGCILYGMV